MPEAAAFRVDLRPSRRKLLARTVARGLSVAAVAACVSAYLLDPSSARLGAAALSVAALVFAFCPGRRESPGWVRFDAAGALRLGSGDEGQPAEVAYCGPRYLCLAAGGRRLPVFADAVAAADWRRLLVACRWARPAAAAAEIDPRPARTK